MDRQRIAVVGGGPIGLEAALYGRELGHDVVVLERGAVADNIRRWGFVTLFSPWGMNTTPLGLRAAGTRVDPGTHHSGEEYRGRYLLPLSRSPALRGVIRENTTVLAVGRESVSKSDAIGRPERAASPFRLLLRNADGSERVEQADIVLDCSGTYGNHRWAGRGGIPAPGERALGPAITYLLPDVFGADRDTYAGKHTLVLGCGYSAATVLAGFQLLGAESPTTRVSWAIRRPGQALRALNDDALEARRNLVQLSMMLAKSPPAWLQFLGNCAVESFAPQNGQVHVALTQEQTSLSLTVDRIIALVGYLPDYSLYEQLQVQQCYATHGPYRLAAALLSQAAALGDATDCTTAGQGLAPDVLKNPEPNFFVLGAKSYGTNSNFLLQVGHTQVRDVFRLIHADPALDRYGMGVRGQ